NRISGEGFRTNGIRLDANTVQLTNGGFTQINSGEHVMTEFNLHPPITVMPVLFNNVPARGFPNIQGGQVLLRRRRMRFASPPIMRLVVRLAVLSVTVEVGSRGCPLFNRDR